MRRIAMICILVLWIFALEHLANAELWRYTDRQGRAHFVEHRDLVPQEYRTQAKLIHTGLSVTAQQPQPPQPLSHPPANATSQAQPVTPSSVPVEHTPVHDDPEIAELEKEHAAMKKQADSLNQLNPLSQTSYGSAGGASSLPPQLQWIGKILENPHLKKIQNTLQQPEIIKSVETIIANPYTTYALIADIILLLIAFIIRWRVTPKTMGFLKRILIRFVIWIMFLISVSLVSVIVYGAPLLTLISALIKGFA